MSIFSQRLLLLTRERERKEKSKIALILFYSHSIGFIIFYFYFSLLSMVCEGVKTKPHHHCRHHDSACWMLSHSTQQHFRHCHKFLLSIIRGDMRTQREKVSSHPQTSRQPFFPTFLPTSKSRNNGFMNSTEIELTCNFFSPSTERGCATGDPRACSSSLKPLVE